MKTCLNHLNEKNFTILIIVAMISMPFLEFIGSLNKQRFFYQEEILSLLGFLYFFILFTYCLYMCLTKQDFKKQFVLSDFF